MAVSPDNDAIGISGREQLMQWELLSFHFQVWRRQSDLHSPPTPAAPRQRWQGCQSTAQTLQTSIAEPRPPDSSKAKQQRARLVPVPGLFCTKLGTKMNLRQEEVCLCNKL